MAYDMIVSRDYPLMGIIGEGSGLKPVCVGDFVMTSFGLGRVMQVQNKDPNLVCVLLIDNGSRDRFNIYQEFEQK